MTSKIICSTYEHTGNGLFIGGNSTFVQRQIGAKSVPTNGTGQYFDLTDGNACVDAKYFFLTYQCTKPQKVSYFFVKRRQGNTYRRPQPKVRLDFESKMGNSPYRKITFEFSFFQDVVDLIIPWSEVIVDIIQIGKKESGRKIKSPFVVSVEV